LHHASAPEKGHTNIFKKLLDSYILALCDKEILILEQKMIKEKSIMVRNTVVLIKNT
jgi:hypothetical protein